MVAAPGRVLGPAWAAARRAHSASPEAEQRSEAPWSRRVSIDGWLKVDRQYDGQCHYPAAKSAVSELPTNRKGLLPSRTSAEYEAMSAVSADAPSWPRRAVGSPARAIG